MTHPKGNHYKTTRDSTGVKGPVMHVANPGWVTGSIQSPSMLGAIPKYRHTDLEVVSEHHEV